MVKREDSRIRELLAKPPHHQLVMVLGLLSTVVWVAHCTHAYK